MDPIPAPNCRKEAQKEAPCSWGSREIRKILGGKASLRELDPDKEGYFPPGRRSRTKSRERSIENIGGDRVRPIKAGISAHPSSKKGNILYSKPGRHFPQDLGGKRAKSVKSVRAGKHHMTVRR